MSDLEKIIIENRHNFDLEEPDARHFDRFQKKLRQEAGRKMLSIRDTLRLVATVAIILTSGIVIVKSSKGSGKMAANPAVEEFKEAQHYYAQQVNSRYDAISMSSFTSEKEKEMLLEELGEMDEHYKELMSEFEANPGDEQVLSALIMHYQMKLNVLDQILSQLEQIANTKEYEKASI